MSGKSTFNWCFIGAGMLANTVAGEILPSGRHKVAAVYTHTPRKCRDFAEQWGGKAYDSAEDAILAPDVDGVYIVTPHVSHYEYARLALTLGKPVLCEKPITVTASEAADLFALAQERGVYLAEAMWTWFSPVAHKVKQWYSSGELGQLRRVEASYRCDSRGCAPRCSDPSLAGGALLDIGVYPITYLYRLLGNPVEIQCSGLLEDGIDLSEEVKLTFPGGLTGVVSVSMCDPGGTDTIDLEGDQGQVKYPSFHNASQVELIRRDGTREVFHGDGGYLNQFNLVAGEIRGGLLQSPLVPPSATVDVMKILDECRRQMGLAYPFEQNSGR